MQFKGLNIPDIPLDIISNFSLEESTFYENMLLLSKNGHTVLSSHKARFHEYLRRLLKFRLVQRFHQQITNAGYEQIMFLTDWMDQVVTYSDDFGRPIEQGRVQHVAIGQTWRKEIDAEIQRLQNDFGTLPNYFILTDSFDYQSGTRSAQHRSSFGASAYGQASNMITPIMTYNSTSSSQYTMPLNMGGYANTTRSSYVAHPSDRVNPSSHSPVYYPKEITPVDMRHPRAFGEVEREIPKPVIQKYKQQINQHCMCEDIESVPKPNGNSEEEIREYIGAVLNIGLATTFVREDERRIQVSEGTEHMIDLFYSCRNQADFDIYTPMDNWMSRYTVFLIFALTSPRSAEHAGRIFPLYVIPRDEVVRQPELIGEDYRMIAPTAFSRLAGKRWNLKSCVVDALLPPIIVARRDPTPNMVPVCTSVTKGTLQQKFASLPNQSITENLIGNKEQLGAIVRLQATQLVRNQLRVLPHTVRQGVIPSYQVSSRDVHASTFIGEDFWYTNPAKSQGLLPEPERTFFWFPSKLQFINFVDYVFQDICPELLERVWTSNSQGAIRKKIASGIHYLPVSMNNDHGIIVKMETMAPLIECLLGSKVPVPDDTTLQDLPELDRVCIAVPLESAVTINSKPVMFNIENSQDPTFPFKPNEMGVVDFQSLTLRIGVNIMVFYNFWSFYYTQQFQMGIFLLQSPNRLGKLGLFENEVIKMSRKTPEGGYASQVVSVPEQQQRSRTGSNADDNSTLSSHGRFENIGVGAVSTGVGIRSSELRGSSTLSGVRSNSSTGGNGLQLNWNHYGNDGKGSATNHHSGTKRQREDDISKATQGSNGIPQYLGATLLRKHPDEEEDDGHDGMLPQSHQVNQSTSTTSRSHRNTSSQSQNREEPNHHSGNNRNRNHAVTDTPDTVDQTQSMWNDPMRSQVSDGFTPFQLKNKFNVDKHISPIHFSDVISHQHIAAAMEQSSTIHIRQEVSLPTHTVQVSTVPLGYNPTELHVPLNNPTTTTTCNPTTSQNPTIQTQQSSDQNNTTCPYNPCPGLICGHCNPLQTTTPSIPRTRTLYIAGFTAIKYLDYLRTLQTIPQEIADSFATVYNTLVVERMRRNSSEPFPILEHLFNFLLTHGIALESEASEQPIYVKREIQLRPLGQSWSDYGGDNDDPPDDSNDQPRGSCERENDGRRNDEKKRHHSAFGLGRNNDNMNRGNGNRNSGSSGQRRPPPPPPPGDHSGDDDEEEDDNDGDDDPEYNDNEYKEEDEYEEEENTNVRNNRNRSSRERAKRRRDNQRQPPPVAPEPMRNISSPLFDSPQPSRITAATEVTNSSLQLILAGTATSNAANRMRNQTALLREYNPVTNHDLIPKVKPAIPMLNSVKDMSSQLMTLISVCQLIGVTKWTFMTMLRTGTQLEKAEKFNPKLNFQPIERLHTFVYANDIVCKEVQYDDAESIIQLHIRVLLEIYLKIFNIPIDSVTAKNKLHSILCESPETAVKMIQQMIELLHLVEGTRKEIDELLITEAFRAFTQYDHTLQQQGKFSNLVDEIRTRSKTIHDEYTKSNHSAMSGRELLLLAALEIESDRLNRVIDRGDGERFSLYPYRIQNPHTKPSSQSSQSKNLKFKLDRNQRALKRNKEYSETFVNSSLTPERWRVDKSNWSPAKILHNCGQSPLMETVTEKYHEWEKYAQDSLASSTDSQFIHTFAEYVLNDGDVAELANELEIELEGLEIAAQFVQSTLQISDDMVERQRAKEAESKRQASEQRLAREREINAFRQAGREAATTAIEEHFKGLAPSDDQYEKDDYTDNDEYIIGNQSYKNDRYSREFGNGNRQQKVTYQSYQSRPPYNNRQISAVQSSNRAPTPPDHCSTCGQHKDECTRIAPNYKDDNGVDQCYLRDDLNGRVNINVVSLDMLRLAELPHQQIEKVINSAARYGCLHGMSQQDIEKLKSRVPKSKEAIRQQTLQIKNDM
jgi:hypothetical protein